MSEPASIGARAGFDLRSRAARGGLLALAALVLYALGLAPAIDRWRAGAERARALSGEIAAERAVVARGDAIRAQVTTFEEALAERLAPLPPAGDADGQAYADLQAEWGRLLATTGTTLRNVTWGEAIRAGGVARLPMRVVVAGEVEAMAALVTALSESPWIRFDDLSLQRDPIGERLVLIATVVGYRRD